MVSLPVIAIPDYIYQIMFPLTKTHYIWQELSSQCQNLMLAVGVVEMHKIRQTREPGTELATFTHPDSVDQNSQDSPGIASRVAKPCADSGNSGNVQNRQLRGTELA